MLINALIRQVQFML